MLLAGCQRDTEIPDTDSERNTNIKDVYSFVVLGDSYSTFAGCNPSGYLVWYPNEENGVTEQSQTWWSLLSLRRGFTMLFNSSYSGSTICNTGYNGVDSSQSSFVTRMKRDIVAEGGYAGTCGSIPDLVLIFGGTNDYWAGSPFGKAVPKEEWRNANLKECLPATCYMLGYLRENLPHARIVLMMNTDLGPEFYYEFSKAAEEYGVDYLELKDISKQSGHPDKSGMVSIANQLFAFLRK